MKNSSDTVGNRTRDLPACSAVPQLTMPPHAHTSTAVSRSFMIFASCRILLELLNLKCDVGGTCDIRGLWPGNLREIDRFEDIDLGGKMIIKWI